MKAVILIGEFAARNFYKAGLGQAVKQTDVKSVNLGQATVYRSIAVANRVIQVLLSLDLDANLIDLDYARDDKLVYINKFGERVSNTEDDDDDDTTAKRLKPSKGYTKFILRINSGMFVSNNVFEDNFIRLSELQHEAFVFCGREHELGYVKKVAKFLGAGFSVKRLAYVSCLADLVDCFKSKGLSKLRDIEDRDCVRGELIDMALAYLKDPKNNDVESHVYTHVVVSLLQELK